MYHLLQAGAILKSTSIQPWVAEKKKRIWNNKRTSRQAQYKRPFSMHIGKQSTQ